MGVKENSGLEGFDDSLAGVANILCGVASGGFDASLDSLAGNSIEDGFAASDVDFAVLSWAS